MCLKRQLDVFKFPRFFYIIYNIYIFFSIFFSIYCGIFVIYADGDKWFILLWDSENVFHTAQLFLNWLKMKIFMLSFYLTTFVLPKVIAIVLVTPWNSSFLYFSHAQQFQLWAAADLGKVDISFFQWLNYFHLT